MMFERSIALGCLAAWTSWLLGLVLTLGDLFDFTPDDSGFVGLALVGAGMWIGLMKMIATMECRERRAFELGVEAASVRRVR